MANRISIALALFLSLALHELASCRESDKDSRDALSAYGGSNGPVFLLRMASVRKELRLTPDQISKADALYREVRAESRRLYRGTTGGQGTEHEQRMAKIRKKDFAITTEINRQVLGFLSGPQVMRLDELYVRFLGPRALFAPQIAARLKISETQQKALADAVRAGDLSLAALRKLLTPQQRDRLEKMQGKSFAFPQPKFTRSPGR